MSGLLEQIGLMLLAQTSDVVGSPDVAEAASAVEVNSVWDFIRKGGAMMIPIGICSLVAMTVVAERLVTLRRRHVIPLSFLPGLRKQLNGKGGDAIRNRARALAYCRESNSPVSRVFAAGIKKLGGPIEVVERHIQDAGQREVLKLRKYLRVLSVTAAVTPLMGLLGTIFGMIRAFQTVAMSAEALGKTEMLAGGIYEAMITTAAGLVVAIPTLICYHWLAAKVQNLVMDIDLMTVDFVEEIVAGGVEGGVQDGAGATPPVENREAAKRDPDVPDLGIATT